LGWGPAGDLQIITTAQAMTKAELIQIVHEKIGGKLTKKATAEAVQATFDALSEAINDGGRFKYPGFGMFLKDCKSKGQCKKQEYRFEADGTLITWAVKTGNKPKAKTTINGKKSAMSRNKNAADAAWLIKKMVKYTGKYELAAELVDAVFDTAARQLQTSDRFDYPDFGSLEARREATASGSRITSVEFSPAQALVKRAAP